MPRRAWHVRRASNIKEAPTYSSIAAFDYRVWLPLLYTAGGDATPAISTPADLYVNPVTAVRCACLDAWDEHRARHWFPSCQWQMHHAWVHHWFLNCPWPCTGLGRTIRRLMTHTRSAHYLSCRTILVHTHCRYKLGGGKHVAFAATTATPTATPTTTAAPNATSGGAGGDGGATFRKGGKGDITAPVADPVSGRSSLRVCVCVCVCWLSTRYSTSARKHTRTHSSAQRARGNAPQQHVRLLTSHLCCCGFLLVL